MATASVMTKNAASVLVLSTDAAVRARLRSALTAHGPDQSRPSLTLHGTRVNKRLSGPPFAFAPAFPTWMDLARRNYFRLTYAVEQLS